MKTKFSQLIFVLLFSGCMPVMKLYYGYHDPGIEDAKSITRYLEKKRIAADNILVFADSNALEQRMRVIQNFPAYRVFNKLGAFVYFKDTGVTCNSSAYNFSDSICEKKELRTNSSKTIDSEMKGLLTLDNHLPEVDVSDYDYLVFIYWTVWEGRLNKTEVRAWENSLKGAKGCKVKIYKVNMDYQKKWYEQSAN